MKKNIVPRYKLMLFFDLLPGTNEAYYSFVMNEMVPTAQSMGLYMVQVYHTVWGECPLRQAEFVSEDLETLQEVLDSDSWQGIEHKLNSFVSNYHRKIVPFRPGFQL